MPPQHRVKPDINRGIRKTGLKKSDSNSEYSGATELKVKMEQMHRTREEYFQTFSELDVTPRQKFLKEQEEIFLHAYANMILHKRLKEERMVSPCTVPFWTSTDTQKVSTEKTENKIQKNRVVEKHQIASKLNFHEDDITLKEEKSKDTDKNEWTQAQNAIIIKPTPTTKEKTVESNKNYYSILSETDKQQDGNEEGEEEESDIKKEVETSKIKPKTCNVNTMTIEEVEEAVVEVKKECEKKTVGEIKSARYAERTAIDGEIEEETECATAVSENEESDESDEDESTVDIEEDEDSLSNDNVKEIKDVLVLQQTIDKLRYQNEVNIQRMHELECEDESKSLKLIEKEKMIMKCKKENEELKKEIEFKKGWEEECDDMPDDEVEMVDINEIWKDLEAINSRG